VAWIQNRTGCRTLVSGDTPAYEGSVSGNFFGLAVARDNGVKQIDGEFKMKVWENLKFENGTIILDKDWIRPTFSGDRNLWGHYVKKPIFDLASEVTSYHTKMGYRKRGSGNKLIRDRGEISVKEKYSSTKIYLQLVYFSLQAAEYATLHKFRHLIDTFCLWSFLWKVSNFTLRMNPQVIFYKE